MKVVIVGTGYVGLVTGACLAKIGFEVVCVDKDTAKIAKLRKGIIPIYEPGLEEIVKHSVAEGRLIFSADLANVVGAADIVFITVGTPIGSSGEGADLSFVLQAAQEIGEHLQGYTVIVAKSTVPVGTARQISDVIRKAKPGVEFDIVSNPEFLREGSAVQDFFEPDRIIVGVRRVRAEQYMRVLYETLTEDGVPLVVTSNEAAEVIKYSSNTYLAMRIALVNQLADICESVGADITEVTYGMGLDHRIGLHYLQPGPGFGGSCFPKDARALVATARQAGTPTTLIEATIEANERRTRGLADRIKKVSGGTLQGKRIGILGIAFKAHTDDIRDSAAITLIPALQKAGAFVQAYDPAAQEQGKLVFTNVKWSGNGYDAAQDADALVVLTEWPEFKSLDLAKLSAAMKRPVIVDMRNLFDLDDIANTPLDYHSIGRVSIYGSEFARDTSISSKKQKMKDLKKEPAMARIYR